MERVGRKRKIHSDGGSDNIDGMESKRSKSESLEVTGVSRSGRVRKKSSKLMDFESTDEMDNRHKRKQNDKSESSLTPKQKKMHKTKAKVDDSDDGGSQNTVEESKDHNNGFNNKGESDTDNDNFQQQLDDDDDDDDDDEDFEADEIEDVDEVDDVDDDEEDDEDEEDDDDIEGQLVVDEKTPTQSLYMMEKSKKKLVIKDGKVVSTKAQRKDKGKARFTAYMMWAKEIRQELSKQYPDMDFTTMARKLSELWGTVPNSERELWRRKAKREASKKQKSKQDTTLMPSRKFINKRSGPVQPNLNNSSSLPSSRLSPLESQQQLIPVAKKPLESISGPGMYKVTGIAPIDVAAHLKLLGESLFIIGERLQEHEGQIAVSGSLSVLLDSLLCALGPLLCLTQQIEEVKSNKQVLSKILQNVAYMMPGLG